MHCQPQENLKESKTSNTTKIITFNKLKTQYFVMKPLEGFEPPTC